MKPMVPSAYDRVDAKRKAAGDGGYLDFEDTANLIDDAFEDGYEAGFTEAIEMAQRRLASEAKTICGLFSGDKAVDALRAALSASWPRAFLDGNKSTESPASKPRLGIDDDEPLLNDYHSGKLGPPAA